MTYTPAEANILAQMASMASDNHTDATDMGFQCRAIQDSPAPKMAANKGGDYAPVSEAGCIVNKGYESERIMPPLETRFNKTLREPTSRAGHPPPRTEPPLALPTYHGIEPPMGKPRNATEEIANARAEIERETK